MATRRNSRRLLVEAYAGTAEIALARVVHHCVMLLLEDSGRQVAAAQETATGTVTGRGMLHRRVDPVGRWCFCRAEQDLGSQQTGSSTALSDRWGCYKAAHTSLSVQQGAQPISHQLSVEDGTQVPALLSSLPIRRRM